MQMIDLDISASVNLLGIRPLTTAQFVHETLLKARVQITH